MEDTVGEFVGDQRTQGQRMKPPKSYPVFADWTIFEDSAR